MTRETKTENRRGQCSNRAARVVLLLSFISLSGFGENLTEILLPTPNLKRHEYALIQCGPRYATTSE